MKVLDVNRRLIRFSPAIFVISLLLQIFRLGLMLAPGLVLRTVFDRLAAAVPLDRHCYRLIWSSSVTDLTGQDDWNHRIWSTTTTDWATYTPAQLFFDPGYSVIDATVVAHDGGYFMAFKDERGENRAGTAGKAIRVCFAPHAHGPWTQISALVTPPLTEGPALFRRDTR